MMTVEVLKWLSFLKMLNNPKAYSYIIYFVFQVARIWLKFFFLFQVVVPSSYRPKSGALFKARALQYCLEEDVNVLADTDWIVHLDEETLATEAAIRGILNFVIEGRHQFGQVSV